MSISYPFTNDKNRKLYPQIANNNLFSRQRFSPLTPILDCGAEETSIPEGAIPLLSSRIHHIPTMAIYPNGDTTFSSSAVAVQSGSIDLEVKVYDNDKLMRPLIAAHDITSQGHTIVLNNYGLTVQDREGKIIARSSKDPDTRLWSMPALKAVPIVTSKHLDTASNAPGRSVSNIVHHSVHASLTSYANATMGSPPDRTMQQALDRDYFQYPGPHETVAPKCKINSVQGR